jgi:hypothetical protein
MSPSLGKHAKRGRSGSGHWQAAVLALQVPLIPFADQLPWRDVALVRDVAVPPFDRWRSKKDPMMGISPVTNPEISPAIRWPVKLPMTRFPKRARSIPPLSPPSKVPQ